jgi:hypothetical protein
LLEEVPMNRLAAVVAVWLALSPCVLAQVNMPDDAAAIRAVWDEAASALVGKDWGRYSKVWAHDENVQVVHPTERSWLTGWPHLEARYRSLISSNVRLAAQTRRFELRIGASRDVAWATTETLVTVNDVAHTSWGVGVFQKREGRWRMVLFFDGGALPPEPAK